MAAAKSEHALWAGNPTVIICLLGFLDLFGVSMIMPLIQSHAKELGASPSVAGLIGSIYGFLQLFSSPIVGKWSDLVGHRIVLLICLMATGGGYVLLGLSSSLILLALSRIPSGLFKHTQTISKAYLAEVIPPEQRATVYGQFNAVSSVGFIIGPTVGGHLAESSSSGFVFVGLLAGLVFFTSAVLLHVCIPAKAKAYPDKTGQVSLQSHQSLLHQTQQALQPFKNPRVHHLWDIFLIRFLLGFAFLLFRTNFSRILLENFDSRATTTGYVLSFTSVIGTVSSLGAGALSRYYDDDLRLIFHMVVLLLIGFCGLLASSSLFLFTMWQVPLSVSSSVLRVVLVTFLVTSGGQSSDSGELIGLTQSTMSVARTITPFLSGVFLEVHPKGPVLAACFVILVALFVLTLTVKKVEKKSYKKYS